MNQAEIITTYRNEAGTATIKTELLSADFSFNVERTDMAAASNGIEFIISIPDVTAIRAFGIGCKKSAALGGITNDGTVSLTVKTNDNTLVTSTVGTGDVFVITPTNGAGWSLGDLPTVACPIKTAITKIFVTANTPSSGPAAKFDFFFRVLLDSTPADAT